MTDTSREQGPLDRAIEEAHDAWLEGLRGQEPTGPERFDAGFMAGWNAALQVAGVSSEVALDRLREQQA